MIGVAYMLSVIGLPVDHPLVVFSTPPMVPKRAACPLLPVPVSPLLDILVRNPRLPFPPSCSLPMIHLLSGSIMPHIGFHAFGHTPHKAVFDSADFRPSGDQIWGQAPLAVGRALHLGEFVDLLVEDLEVGAAVASGVAFLGISSATAEDRGLFADEREFVVAEIELSSLN